MALYSDANSAITIGYTTGNPDEGSVEVIPVFSFDPEKPNSAPYIINTVDGTIFPDNLNGGITVENGLITGWSMHAVKDNTLISNSRDEMGKWIYNKYNVRRCTN